MNKPGTVAVRTNWTAALVFIVIGIIVFFGAVQLSTPRTDAKSVPVVRSCKNVTVKKIGNKWYTVKASNGARVIYEGVAKNEKGWWKVSGGTVDWHYTGIAKNDYGWWRIENGRFISDANGVYKNEKGWWKVENGKVNFGFTGFASNDYGNWRIVNGMVRFDHGGLIKDQNNQWFFVTNGRVDVGYDGLVINNYGAWYVREGVPQFDFEGTVNGYSVSSGRVTGAAPAEPTA